MHAAAMFYPSDCRKIETMLAQFSQKADFKNSLPFKPKALIVPHAGYIYSGYTANSAYKLVNSKEIKRVVVVGPSHKVHIKGASISLQDEIETPCGNISVDKYFAKLLMKQYDFLSFDTKLHHEHSTETQMPFIQHYFKRAKVVEIVYGEINTRMLAPLMAQVMQEEGTLLVVSTDLSHFYTLDEAKKHDAVCLKAVKTLDYQSTKNGCEACGLIGLKALLQVAKEHAYHSRLVDYRTSFDTSRDAKSVVGYMSALIG